MNSAPAYLRRIEWSLGNGQCPECYGVPEDWLGHPCYPTRDTLGHKPGCQLAEALRDVGEAPLTMGDSF
jgi:hypothetical protein